MTIFSYSVEVVYREGEIFDAWVIRYYQATRFCFVTRVTGREAIEKELAKLEEYASRHCGKISTDWHDHKNLGFRKRQYVRVWAH